MVEHYLIDDLQHSEVRVANNSYDFHVVSHHGVDRSLHDRQILTRNTDTGGARR